MDFNPKNTYRKAPKSILKHQPVFRKLISTERSHVELIDFNSTISLQKLESLLKIADDVCTGTRVYSDNKEFLVNLVNDRHANIVQLLKDNIETVKLICSMDRNYRSGLKSAPKLKSHFILPKPVESKPKNLPIPNDLIKEINTLNYGGPQKTLPVSEHYFRPMSMDEINTIISDTAKRFDNSSVNVDQNGTNSELFVYQISDPSEPSVIMKEDNPLIIDDINLSDAVNYAVTDEDCPIINQNDNLDNSEFYSIVVSTPNNYKLDELQTYFNTLNQTESVNGQDYVSEIMW
jgi:hypothetical protein